MGTEIVHQHSLKYLLFSVEDKIYFLRPTQIKLTEQSHTILKYLLIKQAKSIMKVKQELAQTK